VSLALVRQDAAAELRKATRMWIDCINAVMNCGTLENEKTGNRKRTAGYMKNYIKENARLEPRI
jgi:hypothetical protein